MLYLVNVPRADEGQARCGEGEVRFLRLDLEARCCRCETNTTDRFLSTALETNAKYDN